MKALLRVPVRLAPAPLTRRLFVQALNQVFGNGGMHEDLAFMDGRIVQLRIEDIPLEIAFTREDERFRVASPRYLPDLVLQGSVPVYWQLVTRQADPDTLFFQRRLRVQGDTELGLNVKNYLAAWEPDERLQAILDRLQRSRALITRMQDSSPL